MEQMNRHDGMPTAAKRKRIPYGLMNFMTLRERDCYYVDKTRFIESIEEANMFFFFIRPRRFGKSLTISMLQNYYDINKKEQFDKLFGGLYIGENPTPERNSYLVLPLNFATVDAGLDNYRAGLDNCVNIGILNFCDRYKQYLPDDIIVRMKEECQGCVDQLKFLAAECENVNQHIYLFIDEYDHFTNKILAEPKHMVRYREQTHGEGYLRMFFDAVKDATSSSLARVFVTGVSPVTMDDLTSGFNIGTNYSLSYEFNELVGFTGKRCGRCLRIMQQYARSIIR